MTDKLSMANFTFRKESIHEPPFEEVRQAAKGQAFFKKLTKDPKAAKDTPNPNPNKGPEVVSVTNSVLTVHKSSDGTWAKGKSVVRAVAKKHTGKRSNNTLFEGENASKKPRMENGSG